MPSFPLLAARQAVDKLMSPRVGIDNLEVLVPRSDGSGTFVQCALFYDGTRNQLMAENRSRIHVVSSGYASACARARMLHLA